MLGRECYGDAARRFARCYAAFDPARQRRAMRGRVEELLADGPVGDGHERRAAGELAALGA